jgi:hypothetical protein
MASSLTAQLRADPPLLHEAGTDYWGLAWPALEWLERIVEPRMATFETGTGSSTVVFAACGAEHEAVSPFADEHGRIREQARAHGISTEHVRFHVAASHELLPRWEPRRPLDLVLIDGAHGFPYPVLDWWYLAPHVRVGGLMLLDDAYMPPVAMLVDHCRASPSWRVERSVGYRTAIVRKLDARPPPFDWHGERLGGRLGFRFLPPGERVVAAARHRVFSTTAGLASIRLARRRLPILFR